MSSLNLLRSLLSKSFNRANGCRKTSHRKHSLRLEIVEPRRVLAAPQIEWIDQFGTPGDRGSADSVQAVDVSGAIYVAGHTNGSLEGQNLSGLNDIFLRKYDADGTELWTTSFGTDDDDRVTGITVDDTGVYLVGERWVTIEVDENSSRRHTDAFIRKFALDGTELWERAIGTLEGDEAQGVTFDSTGIYVAGVTGGSLDGQPAPSSLEFFVRKYDTAGSELWTTQFATGGGSWTSVRISGITANGTNVFLAGQTDGLIAGSSSFGSIDAFVFKLDVDGNELWTRQFGTSSSDNANGVAVDAAGVYVVGSTSGVFPGQLNSGSSDVFVRKYDNDGNELWTRQIGTSSIDSAIGVGVVSGGIFVGGRTSGTFPGETNAGSWDAFVHALDSAGNDVWFRQLGSMEQDDPFAITADDTGVILAGRTLGVLPGQSSDGSTFADAFVHKYDLEGTDLWTRQFGFTELGTDYGTAVGSDGSVYVAGGTNGSLPGHTNFGLTDAFVRKYDASGAVLWTRQFGTESFDVATGVAIDSTGIYVTGNTNSSFPGHSNAGSTDVFLQKYDFDGSTLWTQQFGSSGLDEANGVAADSSGIYFVGRNIVRKFDIDGNELWSTEVLESSSDSVTDVSVDASGVYLTGVSRRDKFVTKLDVAGNELWSIGFRGGAVIPSIATHSSGIYVLDRLIYKFDSDGNEVWSRGTTSVSSRGSSVFANATGFYITGYTADTLTGQTSAGGLDAIVLKFDHAGNDLWAHQFGSDGNDRPAGISVAGSAIYVTGSTDGALPGQAHSGYDDAFVVKLTEGTPPVSDPGGPYLADEGASVGLDGSASVDADGTITSYEWDFDYDGVNFDVDSAGVTTTLDNLDGPLTRTVALRVTDDSGITDIATASLTVTNVPPTVALSGAPNADEGELYTLTFGAVGDPGDDTIEQCIVNWGDGTIDTYTAAEIAADNNVTHTYLDDLGGTIVVDLVDEDGTHLAAATKSITVRNVKPAVTVADADIDDSSGTFARYTATGSFVDPGLSDSWTVTVDFKDGTVVDISSEVVTDPSDPTGRTKIFQLSHDYYSRPDKGQAYRIDVTVADDDGGSDTKPDDRVVVVGTLGGDDFSVQVGSIIFLADGQTIGTYEDLAGFFIWGGPGDDTIEVEPDISVLTVLLGGDGSDTIVAGSGDNVIDGGEGNDTLTGGTGTNLLIGGAGDDLLRDGGGTNTVVGGGGSNTFVPGGGDNEFESEPGSTSPEVYSDTYNVAEDGQLSVTAQQGVLANDIDPNGLAFSATLVTAPVYGTLSLNGDGSFTYEPDVDFLGSDTFSYTAGNGNETSDATQVTINVEKAVADGELTIDGEGVVRIGGTTAGDTIVVSQPSNGQELNVEVNGVDHAFLLSDVIEVRVWSRGGTDQVHLNGLAYESFVVAGDGDDTVQVSGGLAIQHAFYGGAGKDRLRGGQGNDILVGGPGDDLLVGKSGRDLLIGGLGADRIIGNASDDLLIAAVAHFNRTAANEVLNRWTADEDISDRQQAILGYMAANQLKMVDDNERDILTGSSGTDWFFANFEGDGVRDKVTDLDDELFASDLDWILQ